MSKQGVEIIRNGMKAFLENDLGIEGGKVVEWRMFGPVEEAFEALNLTQHDAQECLPRGSRSSVVWAPRV